MNINIDDLVHLMQNLDNIPEDGIRFFMNKILSMEPNVGWEMGNDDNDCTYVCLTAHGNPDKLIQIEKELELPIYGTGWSIISGCPRKQWDSYFEILDADGNYVGIDGKKWGWIAEARGEKICIELFTNDIGRNLDIYGVAEILLIGEIGERCYADNVTIVDVFSLKKKPEMRFGSQYIYDYLLENFNLK